MRRSLLEGVVLEALTGGGRRLFSETIHFCACPRLASSASSRSHWSSVVDALSLCCSLGGCFATVIIGWSSIRADALPSLLVVVGWSGGCFATLLGLQIFAPLAVQFLLAGSVVWDWLGSQVRVSLFYVVLVFFSLVCVFFSVSLLLVLCALVLVNFCLTV